MTQLFLCFFFFVCSQDVIQQNQAQQQQISQQQSQQQQQQNQQHQTMTREVLIGNQALHVQVLQGSNTAQVIKYEINIPQEGQTIE